MDNKTVLLFVILVSITSVCCFKSKAVNAEASVVYDEQTNTFKIQQGISNDAVAFGNFNDSLDLSGWGVLRIKTNKAYPDEKQMFAAGYLEGYLTAERIYQNYLNMYDVFFSQSPPSANLLKFLQVQDAWTRSQISGNISQLTPYWQQVAFIVAQYDGLVAGYQASSNTSLDEFAFQMLNGVGDFLDLLSALDNERRINWSELSKEELLRKLAMNGHCSGLIKVNGDLSDIWVGHSSWFTYGAMNRIYKHYYFDLNANFVAAKKMSFSSYPGFLESLDDFYIMDSGLSMIQTTNSILNYTLYEQVTPQALFAWQRVRLANSMAHNGREWGQLYAEYNTGTYNNQYMVINFNLFVPGAGLPDGTLYVVEQIPGLVLYADVTHELERGYWPSYNIPYFEQIFNLSGYPGYGISYQTAPRANIFRRDQATVVDMDSFKAIMRYNNYKNDPYSQGDPGNAICSRFDLETNGPEAAGCYDTKVTSFSLQSEMISYALNGPTTSHGLPPFEWTSTFNSTSHVGMPFEFNFDFVTMNPNWNSL